MAQVGLGFLGIFNSLWTYYLSWICTGICRHLGIGVKDHATMAWFELRVSISHNPYRVRACDLIHITACDAPAPLCGHTCMRACGLTH